MQAILIPVAVLSVLGVLFGAGLAWASKTLAVEADPRIGKVREALPGANCGACGFPGCDGLAGAIVEGRAGVSACPVGGASCAAAIAAVMGVEAALTEPLVATVICQGRTGTCGQKYQYAGIGDCRAAVLASGGGKACRYSCLGLGTCMRACPFDAITMHEGIARIDEQKCTGCTTCVAVCPKSVLRMEPRSRHVAILCRATEKGKAVREACTAGCIACGKCFRACQYGAIQMIDNLPRIDYEKCVQCGDCARACPTGAMNDSKPIPVQ